MHDHPGDIQYRRTDIEPKKRIIEIANGLAVAVHDHIGFGHDEQAIIIS